MPGRGRLSYARQRSRRAARRMTMTERRPPGSAATSDALRSSVLERINRLDRRERAVLMCASVIGLRFDLGILTASAGCAPAHVESALANACRLQLLEADATRQGSFAFRHALTRDVIYDELRAARTRPLHRRIARALECLPADETVLEQIAYHWWAAGDVRRGLRANELAGDRAAAVHATNVALVHYRRAFGVAPIGSSDYLRLAEKVRVAQDLDAQG